MAEEIVTSPEESVSMDAPIVESPVEVQEDVVEVEPTPPANTDGANNLMKLHKILAADELYSRIVPADFKEFLSNYSDPSKLQKLHKILAADELYGRIMPSDINEAADKYGFGGLGKPSAVPSPSVSGGSATKGRGVEQPSTLPQKSPSEVEEITNVYGWDTTLRDELPTYLTPEELESGARAEAKLPSEQTIAVKREEVKQKANMPSAKVIEETTPEMLAEGQQRIIKREAERALFENKAKQGNFLGMLQNSLIEGFTSTVNNTADFTLYLMSLGGIGVSPEYDAASNQEKARIFSEALDDVGIKKTLDKQLKTASTTQEYTQKRTEEGGPIMEGVVGLAGSVFPMFTPQQSGFFISGFVDSKKEIQEAMPELSPWKQAAYAFTQGAVQVALERAGLSNLIQNKSVTRALSGKVMDAMKTTFGKFTAKEADAFATKVVNGFFAEAETGATQYFVSEGLRQLADALEGEDDKFEFEGGEEFILNIMKSGISEGVGGVIMKSMAELPSLIKSPLKKKEAAAVNAQTEQLAADIQNPNVSPEAKVAIDKQINDNAEDVAKAYAEDLNKYEALSEESRADLNRINQDIISHEAVLNDPNVSPETKAISEQRIQELEEQGEGILDSVPAPKPTAPVSEPTTEQAPQAEATTEENQGNVEFNSDAVEFINETRDRLLSEIKMFKKYIDENKPKTIRGKLANALIYKKNEVIREFENYIAETESELNELDTNPIEYFKRKKENNPDEETKQYFQDSVDYLEQNRITPQAQVTGNIGDTVDLTPLVESSKAKVEVQADSISKEDNDKWTSIIDQSTSPRELDKIIDSIDSDGKMTPELITAINTKRESLSPQAAPTAEAPQTLPEVENAIADLRKQEQAENEETYNKYDEAITPLLKQAKAEIEARRKEALQQEPIRTDNGYEKTFNYGEENEYTIVGESSQDYYDKINAKYDAEVDALNKPTTEAQAPVAEETKGESGAEGDGFKQAGEKARDTKDATHIGRWMLDNSQKGDVVRFQDGGYEVTEVTTKKDGTKELVLTPFEFNEDGSKDYNNTGVKIITEQSIKNGSNLFENAYTNSKGERVIEQSTYEPVAQSLKETPTSEQAPVAEAAKGEATDDARRAMSKEIDSQLLAKENELVEKQKQDIQKAKNDISAINNGDKSIIDGYVKKSGYKLVTKEVIANNPKSELLKKSEGKYYTSSGASIQVKTAQQIALDSATKKANSKATGSKAGNQNADVYNAVTKFSQGKITAEEARDTIEKAGLKVPKAIQESLSPTQEEAKVEEVTSKIEEPKESKPKATTTKAPSEQTKAERLQNLREKARSIKASRPIASAAGAVVKAVKNAINWQKTKEGFKETKISARNPLLTQAAKDLSQGKITNEEYRAIESKSSPILPIENFLDPATESQVANSVDKSKVQSANKPVAPNKRVGLRIDIPAFRNNNVWVISVHDGSTKTGSIISYKGAARITDVTFGTQSPASSLKIATGQESKNAQVGRIFGNWNNFDGKTAEEQNQNAKELVEQIANDPSWVQVGMNPFRHSYFYDRSNDLGRPVVSAKEVVQIGGLVYAKDVVYGNWNDEAYKVKGMLDKAGEPVFFSKKPKANVIASELEIDQEIVDAMNEMELVNEGADLSPATTKQKTDVKELNERLDTPLKEVKWGEFEGMPFGFTISDQLRSGDVINPSTDDIVDNLKGGIGFNGTEGNQDKAWAVTTEAEANVMHEKALKVYNNNKPLFEKLWAEGKLPQGVVPFSVVKMAETSILSNEAVSRVGAQNISTLPVENRKAAMVVMKQELARKIAKERADLKRGTKTIEEKGTKKIIDTKEPYSENTKKSKTKLINQYQNILDIINDNNYRDIVDLLNNDKKFSLPERVLIGSEIFYGKPTPIAGEKVDPTKSRPGTATSKALIKGNDTSLINIGNITDVLTEPSMKDVPNVHIIAVVGVKVADSKNGEWIKAGGPIKTNHPNYPYAVKGQSIGVLSQPIHVKDAFGEAYGSAMSQITKNEANDKSITLKEAVSQGIPVQSGMPNRSFISAIAKNNLDAVDKLSGFLRQAFPGTTFFTSQDAWDAAMQDPAVSKKLKDGDVVYAFTKNGNVFINPNLKTTKATLHESGHIWMDFMKDSNPELFKKGLSLVEGTQELKDAIAEYGDNELAREEALMEIMSTKGDTIVNSAQKAKVKEWLLSVWKYISEQFESLRGLSPQQVEDLTLDKFVEGILADVLSGKEITGKKTKGKTKFSKKQGNDNGETDFVKQSLDEGYSKEDISEMLQEEFGKTEAEANQLIEQNSPKTSEPNIFDDFDASNKRGGLRSQQEAKKAFSEKYGEDAAVAKAISTNFEAIADELKSKGIFTKIEC